MVAGDKQTGYRASLVDLGYVSSTDKYSDLLMFMSRYFNIVISQIVKDNYPRVTSFLESEVFTSKMLF